MGGAVTMRRSGELRTTSFKNRLAASSFSALPARKSASARSAFSSIVLLSVWVIVDVSGRAVSTAGLSDWASRASIDGLFSRFVLLAVFRVFQMS